MFKFSRAFFILFVLLTVLPVFLLILWNTYRFQDIDRSHLNDRLSDITRITSSNYSNLLIDEKKYLEKLINSTKNYNLSLEKYREIIGNDQVWWIESNKNNELTVSQKVPFKIPSEYLSKDMAYYDVIYNNKKHKESLVWIFIIPAKVSGHKGIAIVHEIPYEKLSPDMPPALIRIYSGKEYKHSNLFYDNFRDKFFKDKKHKPPGGMLNPKPPKLSPRNLNLIGKKFGLKDYSGKTIATVEIGVPAFRLPFWIFPNPMLAGVFEKFYIIGALIPVLGLILSIFAGLYLKKYYLNPIEDLSRVSEMVSSGDLSVRVETEIKHSELKNTLVIFNKMLDSLQEKKQLRENFITNLTHDFRTPLLAENRTLEILIEEFEEDLKLEQKDLLESLLKNNEHLLDMVNMILETYKFESGGIVINKTSVNVEKILQQCFMQLKTLADDKNIELKLEFEPNIPKIMLDPNLIKRSFLNLIANAVENIPKNSKIIVSGNVNNSELRIKFWDNGPGIAEKDVDKLFDRYYTGNHIERKIGSGLGLYICKKFIEAHQGKIDVKTLKGEYSEFIVSLPLV